jgi:type VI secretion system Hcp family effector
MALSQRSSVAVRARRVVVSAVALCVALSATPAFAAVNAYLSLSGINGPSTSFPGAIDILSFSVGVAGPTTATRLKPSCSNLSVFKFLDQTTPQLAQAVVLGQTFTSAVVTYVKPVAGTQQTYFTITLPNATLTSDQLSGSNENPSESVSLKASTMTLTFFPQKADGTLGDPVVSTVSCP